MRRNDPFGFVRAINVPKDKANVNKVHGILFKKRIWKKKKKQVGYGTEDMWQNDIGDILEIEQRQDRDGKNAFLYRAIETNRSSLGTARGKRKIIAKGRNEDSVLKKIKEYTRR